SEKEGRLSGRSGCNRYFASYTLDTDHLYLGPLGATRMLCSPAQMTQEERYFQALTSAMSCELSNGELFIAYTGGTLHFVLRTEEST
ncbi:MAG TPA: META domain-containing protein, partial [Ktedonobacteraceae bacterium]|nr:META domain-containing protein [Ktedonobacteraceae bacterium]